jgi:hypothetical protein
MIRIGDAQNGKITTTETYKNWKLDGAIAKVVFSFKAPDGVKKVDDFDGGQAK